MTECTDYTALSQVVYFPGVNESLGKLPKEIPEKHEKMELSLSEERGFALVPQQ